MSPEESGSKRFDLALKVEEGARSQGMWQALGDGKCTETHSLLESPERNAALLTP